VNLVRDHAKSRRVSFWRRLVGLEAEHANVADVSAPSQSPERVLLARSELQAVWAAVDFLSPSTARVFLLRVVEELSLAEIGRSAWDTSGQRQAQLFRALGSVRKQVKEQQWR